MSWNQQTVLVTGAGGFIGSHLVERLVHLGAKTRALVRYTSSGSWGWIDRSPLKDQIEVFAGDIRDRDSLSQPMKGVEVVFHLAALIGIPYSYHTPLSYLRTNAEGTLNVLHAALEAGVKLVVQTSTSEVYGTARTIPINESHPLQGQSPYSASKIAADKLAEAFHLSFGLPVATVRPFNTYGPRQSARAIIPTIITQAVTGDQVRLGNLRPVRDFNYVADTVDGFIRTAESDKTVGQVINIGSGREIAIDRLAMTILELLGKPRPILFDEQRVRPPHSEVERLCADTTKARTLLGWQPRYSLEQGLKETIEWIQTSLETYRSGVYAV